jgi:hypothetical protein
MELKGQCFEADFSIQRETQAVVGSINENYSHSAFEAWKKMEVTVNVAK